MKLRYWFLNPIGILQHRYQKTIHQVENHLDIGVLSLPQPATWTKRLTQVILVGLTATGVWSVIAQVDVVVTATGKLEPMSRSQDIQARANSIVTAVLIHEGEQVKQGQVLLQLDKTSLNNRLKSLSLERDQLVKELNVLRSARQGVLTNAYSHNVTLPPELMNRIQTRQLLVAQLAGNPAGLSLEQRQRFQLFQQQMRDRKAINQLQGTDLETQITRNQEELEKIEFQLEVENNLLADLQPLLEAGAISRTDFMRRSVIVNDLQRELNQVQLQNSQLQVAQSRGQLESRQSVTATNQELQRQLALLDAEFDQTITANQRQLIQLDSQLNQVKLDLKNQDLRAPANGVVFNLNTKLPGAVVQSGQVLLQVVPNESLIARIYVANADIASIRTGMSVDIRVDAYPFTEFGAINGIVSKVGNEALVINENSSQTVFPVEVQLKQQFLERDSEQFNVIPGMSVAGNIIVRSRAPISYITDELIKAFDTMRAVQ